jgi:hypothetical protein
MQLHLASPIAAAVAAAAALWDAAYSWMVSWRLMGAMTCSSIHSNNCCQRTIKHACYTATAAVEQWSNMNSGLRQYSAP